MNEIHWSCAYIIKPKCKVSDVIYHTGILLDTSDHPGVTFTIKKTDSVQMIHINTYPDGYEPVYIYNLVYYAYLLLTVGLVIICFAISKCFGCIGGWILRSIILRKRSNETRTNDKLGRNHLNKENP